MLTQTNGNVISNEYEHTTEIPQEIERTWNEIAILKEYENTNELPQEIERTTNGTTISQEYENTTEIPQEIERSTNGIAISNEYANMTEIPHEFECTMHGTKFPNECERTTELSQQIEFKQHGIEDQPAAQIADATISDIADEIWQQNNCPANIPNNYSTTIVQDNNDLGIANETQNVTNSIAAEHKTRATKREINDKIGTDIDDGIPMMELESHLNRDIIRKRHELTLMLREYGRGRNELIFMVRDLNQQDSQHDNDEKIMHAMDHERKLALRESLTLELDEQRAHDEDLSQLHDDVLHHINASTEQIIAEFANMNHSSDDDLSRSSPVNEFNCDWWHEPSESSSSNHSDNHNANAPHTIDCTQNNDSDDLFGNTDTEDGAEDVVALIQSNMNLIRFLTKQSATIARLWTRIVRLGTLIQDLTAQLNTANSSSAANRTNTSLNLASVLADTKVDTSFQVKPNCDSQVDMRYLDHSKIQQQLERQLAKIKSNENPKDDLWMYFDSGASRSVISTNSPIRKHLQAITPAYGSCFIGDGTPLHYLETGNVTDTLELTIVKDLKYDLFSSVSAAKQGLTSIIDYDLLTGQNKSYTIDKLTD